MSGVPDVNAADKQIKQKKNSVQQASCGSCHADFASVLGKGHPAVKGDNLTSCTTCHRPDFSGKTEKNVFASRMHLAHLASKTSQDCMACHTWVEGKSFGLAGTTGSWGSPDAEDMKLLKETFASWGKPGYMDNMHAKGSIDCLGCHGKEVPKADSTVDNTTCLKCHGPVDKLVKKTAPGDFPDRNPHKSHLGEIACTVCHKAHSASKVYCLDCHKNFKMKIKGADR